MTYPEQTLVQNYYSVWIRELPETYIHRQHWAIARMISLTSGGTLSLRNSGARLA